MQLRIKLLFAQSQHKIFMKCKQEEISASTLAKPPLPLPVPCGLMPRTEGLSQAKLPNGPVNHMQRHEEAYVGLCQLMPP